MSTFPCGICKAIVSLFGTMSRKNHSIYRLLQQSLAIDFNHGLETLHHEPFRLISAIWSTMKFRRSISPGTLLHRYHLPPNNVHFFFPFTLFFNLFLFRHNLVVGGTNLLPRQHLSRYRSLFKKWRGMNYAWPFSRHLVSGLGRSRRGGKKRLTIEAWARPVNESSSDNLDQAKPIRLSTA